MNGTSTKYRSHAIKDHRPCILPGGTKNYGFYYHCLILETRVYILLTDKKYFPAPEKKDQPFYRIIKSLFASRKNEDISAVVRMSGRVISDEDEVWPCNEYILSTIFDHHEGMSDFWSRSTGEQSSRASLQQQLPSQHSSSILPLLRQRDERNLWQYRHLLCREPLVSYLSYLFLPGSLRPREARRPRLLQLRS